MIPVWAQWVTCGAALFPAGLVLWLKIEEILKDRKRRKSRQ